MNVRTPAASPTRKPTAPHAQGALEATRAIQHARCVFCGRENPLRFKLDFQAREDGSVQATFPCGEFLQSYPGMIHGGVVAALLDAAMTNCLFSLGISAVTGELRVRYLRPVDVECTAVITATVQRKSSRAHCLAAELSQGGRVMARATATFVRKVP